MEGTYNERKRNVKFPCPRDDNRKLVTVNDCLYCNNHMKCDIYCTMLDESNDME